jgi:ABC-2 type transport system permease protein
VRRLVRAELYRLSTTRTTWALLAGACALVALVLVPALDKAGVGGNPSLGTPHLRQTIVAAPRFTLYFTVLLGILAVAGEYRHRTIASTFLATPQRTRVVLAKLASYGLAGLGFAVVVVAAALVAALGWHEAKGVSLELVEADVALSVLGLLLVPALFAMIGVGVGSVVTNQAAAMVGAVIWLQIVELSLLAGSAPQLFKWSLNGAAFSLTRIEPPGGLVVLAPLEGGLLLAAYVSAVAFGAGLVTLHRDVV